MKFHMILAAASLLISAQFATAASSSDKPFNCAANANKQSTMDKSQAESQNMVNAVLPVRTAEVRPSAGASTTH